MKLPHVERELTVRLLSKFFCQLTFQYSGKQVACPNLASASTYDGLRCCKRCGDHEVSRGHKVKFDPLN